MSALPAALRGRTGSLRRRETNELCPGREPPLEARPSCLQLPEGPLISMAEETCTLLGSQMPPNVPAHPIWASWSSARAPETSEPGAAPMTSDLCLTLWNEKTKLLQDLGWRQMSAPRGLLPDPSQMPKSPGLLSASSLLPLRPKALSCLTRATADGLTVPCPHHLAARGSLPGTQTSSINLPWVRPSQAQAPLPSNDHNFRPVETCCE